MAAGVRGLCSALVARSSCGVEASCQSWRIQSSTRELPSLWLVTLTLCLDCCVWVFVLPYFAFQMADANRFVEELKRFHLDLADRTTCKAVRIGNFVGPGACA